MTGVELVLAIVKIVIVIAFLLGIAPIAVWADRRQSAMVQDRVGPNRAVVYLPSLVVRGILSGPALLIAGLAAFTATRELSPRAAFEVTLISGQLAVLVVWFSLLILWRVARGGPINKVEEAIAGVNPRSIFYVGLAGHLVALF
ncbi:MAG TPA: hypothetical protein VLS89_12830, partial [Candidatus Nanopelagicales bacterium]|nr:hypothetical protein [Candidatus Nanopelagicales bacterium]